jgi:hypothetical protein
MTRRSKREIDRAVDDLETDTPPDEPPVAWMEDVPQELWSDRTAAWHAYLDGETQ